jgi:hypothetical protein
MCGQKLQRKINNIVDSITIVKKISETKYLVLKKSTTNLEQDNLSTISVNNRQDRIIPSTIDID